MPDSCNTLAIPRHKYRRNLERLRPSFFQEPVDATCWELFVREQKVVRS